MVQQHLILAGTVPASPPGSFLSLATKIETSKWAWWMEVWGCIGGKTALFVCVFKENNKENTLYLVSMEDVDKNPTTKLSFQPAVCLCACLACECPGARQVPALQIAPCQRPQCSHFMPNVQMKPHTRSQEPPPHREMGGGEDRKREAVISDASPLSLPR